MKILNDNEDLPLPREDASFFLNMKLYCPSMYFLAFLNKQINIVGRQHPLKALY